MGVEDKRKIHVDIPTEIHQKLRIKAAYEDVSIQALVADLIFQAVHDIPFPDKKKSARQ